MNTAMLPNTNGRISMAWALQIKATTAEEPTRLIQTMTGAILGCGGWVLSRGANETGVINLLFEFERRHCVEMYTVLVAVGLELSQTAHIRLTELCQCTRQSNEDCGSEIVSIDLEIYSFPLEIAAVRGGMPEVA